MMNPQKIERNKEKLQILYTSDIHSRFENLAKIATIINTERSETSLILDAGDNADFMRIETEGTQGRISSHILNAMGYHVRVFGNNEGFAGPENCKIIAETSNFPVVTCNLYDLQRNPFPFLQDSTIVSINQLKILIIGVTAPYNEFYSLFGMYSKDPIEEVQRVLNDHQKKQDEYDICLLLSHLGLKHDQEIAKMIPELDIIIGGHSHDAVPEPLNVNNCVICQAGWKGQYLGILDLVLASPTSSKHNREKIIQSYNHRLVPSQNYAEDSQIQAIIERDSSIARKFMSQPLFSIEAPLSHSLTVENEIGNLLADGLKDVLKAEIGLINSGVLNGGVHKGQVSKLTLHEICPSPLNPTLVHLKGSDLLVSLEKSLLPDYQNADGRGAGFRGKWLGNLQVSSNVIIQFDPDAQPMESIKMITVDEIPLDLEKIYTVGTSDYLQRGTGYNELGRCELDHYNPEFLRETLAMYLGNKAFRKKAIQKRFNRGSFSLP